MAESVVKDGWFHAGADQGVYVVRFRFSDGKVVTKIGFSSRLESRMSALRGGHDKGPMREKVFEEQVERFVIRVRSRAEAKLVEAAMHLLMDRRHIRGEWFDLDTATFDRLRTARLTAADVVALAAGVIANQEEG